MTELPPRRRVRDAELMRALAHPLRGEILNYLMAVGPRTATECADAVGTSASNCSWHLRQLAHYGLVERAEGENGRERPWRATTVGLDFGELDDNPATRTAQLGVLGAALEEDRMLTQRYLDTIDTQPPQWRDASAINTYALRVTPDELRELVTSIDRLVRPYVNTIRTDPPGDAMPVHMTLRGFPRVEADGTPAP